ncbi:copii coat assembly sec16 [Gossypium australe]|uniref:Copii coat assembly sec16 n=1 Tax=Gossypium australe TaxID=47621 RepID=A0A5B6V5C2_9ROSI|nr:copii coat assembly sec16 [Gossypium australe]
MRLIIMAFAGVIFGFFLGVSFPTVSLTKMHLPSSLFPSIDLTYIEDKYSGLSTQALFNALNTIKANKVDSMSSSGYTETKFYHETIFSLGLSSSSRRLDNHCESPLLLALYSTLCASTSDGVSLLFIHYVIGERAENPLGLDSPFQIWIPTNPRGAERLPPGIVAPESDLFLRRLWGLPSEDLTIKPKYLVTFTVGYNQKNNIDAAVKKFSENFTILLFHYDGLTSEWDEFEWSKRAIHVSVQKQAKWWYAKRFLHPDIVAPYEYIFMWDEDLGVENFNAEEYIKLVKKHGLEISQPGLDANSAGLTWAMTRKRNDTEVHKDTEERPGWCNDPHLPPCAAFVEIMATVFSRDAWRCVWHMIQNDLVHGWGLDFSLRKCVEPPHEKIGVVDAQWIVHQSVPSLGNQGEAEGGRAPWEGVRQRCRKEWTMFQDRMNTAEKAYYASLGITDPYNLTAD